MQSASSRKFGVLRQQAVLAWAACLLLPSPAVCRTKPSAFANQSKPLRATATILAVSSSSRQSFAGNQDVYLADVQVGKNGEHQLVRLMDQYPGFGLPIRASLLRDQTLFRMKVTREPECDVPGSQIFLGTNDAAVFNGAVRGSLREHAGDSIPCFKTLHQTIEIARKK